LECAISLKLFQSPGATKRSEGALWPLECAISLKLFQSPGATEQSEGALRW